MFQLLCFVDLNMFQLQISETCVLENRHTKPSLFILMQKKIGHKKNLAAKKKAQK